MASINVSAISFKKLQQSELSHFISIHENIIPKRKKKMEIYSISEKTSNYSDKKKANYDLIQPILDKVESIFKDNNIFNYDISKYVMEFHQRNCGFEKKQHQLFDWHQDDHGACSFNCHSILFYLRKDKTIKGGDLEYKEKKVVKKHIVSSGDILQFRGDLFHRPQPTSGFGCRDIIAVFVKRVK